MAHFLEKSYWTWKVFWLSLQILSEPFFIPTRINWDIINMHMSSCIYPLFLSDFNETFIFSTDFWKILIYQISWKSVEWESNFSMQTHRWTDRHNEANSCFHNFANAPKNEKFMPGKYYPESPINNRKGKADQISDPLNNIWWRSMPFQAKVNKLQ